VTFLLQVLQNRIRRLLDDKVIEAVKQRERERISQIDAKLAKINAREEEKQRRNQEKMARLSQWNLKDGWGLLRVLQESGLHLKYSEATRPLSISNIEGHCGIPTADSDVFSVDWARLLREIGVDKAKTESNADDYYVDMINRCRRAVFLYGASASSGASKGPDSSANQVKDATSGGGEAAEFEDPDDCADDANNSALPSEDAAGAPSADKKRARKPRGAAMDGSNPLELPKQSFRVLQRVQAVSTVRRMIFRPSLSDEQRRQVIESAPSCGVPGWTAEHDLALLLGVNIHSLEWNSIRMDPNLPFVPLDMENAVPLPEGKVPLLKDYRAAQRVEQLCDLFVTEPWVQAKPIPQIKRPSHMARRSGSGKRNRGKKPRPTSSNEQGGNAEVDGEDLHEGDPHQAVEDDDDVNNDGGDDEQRDGDDDDEDDDADCNEDEDAEEDSDEGEGDDQGESEDDEEGDCFNDPCDGSEASGGEGMGDD
jgi:hypothetical protein